MRRLTTLLPHQVVGYEKLRKIKVGALFMEMGTGKTRTIIEVLNDKYERGKIDKILYCCPSSILKNTLEQFKSHCPEMLNICKLIGTEGISQSDRIYTEALEFVDDKTAIVADESTQIKNFFALRTQRMIELGQKSKYKYVLSGNPIPKNIADLFSQLYFLSPAILGYKCWKTFADQHIIYDKYYHYKIKNTKNEGYLAKVMQPYAYQVKKAECLKLPKKHFGQKYNFVTPGEKIVYEKIKEHYCDIIMKKGDISGIYFCAMIAKILMYASRTKGKFTSLCEAIEDIDCNKKIIVFFRHLKIQYRVHKKLQQIGFDNLFVANGSVANYQDIVEDFKNVSGRAILLINYGVGSYGLNLQSSSDIIYYENTFDYALVEQSENRIHRIGQTEDCKYTNLYCNLKIETVVQNNLVSKINTIKWFADQIKKINEDSSLDKRGELKKLYDLI